MKITRWLVMLLAIFLAACQATPSPTPAETTPLMPTATPTAAAMEEPTAIASTPSTEGESYPAPPGSPGSSMRLDRMFAGGYPAPDLDIKAVTWEEAKTLILDGQVTEVFQLHDLTVTMKLQDGTILQTIEPLIDEVFTVIEQCGEQCGTILRATE